MQATNTQFLHAEDLVVVLQQLDDYLDVVMVVLDRYNAHDVGGVFSVRVFAVFVGQHQARVSFFHLHIDRVLILVLVLQNQTINSR